MRDRFAACTEKANAARRREGRTTRRSCFQRWSVGSANIKVGGPAFGDAGSQIPHRTKDTSFPVFEFQTRMFVSALGAATSFPSGENVKRPHRHRLRASTRLTSGITVCGESQFGRSYKLAG